MTQRLRLQTATPWILCSLFLCSAGTPLFAAPPETEREKTLKKIEDNAQKAHDELDGKSSDPTEDPKGLPAAESAVEEGAAEEQRDSGEAAPPEYDSYSSLSYNKLLSAHRHT